MFLPTREAINQKQRKVFNMYMQQLSDFANFLGQKSHSKDEILMHLALRTFAPLNCNGIFLAELQTNGIVEITSHYGIDDKFFEIHPKKFKLREELPVSDAIKYHKTIWINSLPDWGENYPELKDEFYKYDSKSFICWPIEQAGVPCAALGMFCDEKILDDEVIELFLIAIGNLISLSVFANDPSKSHMPHPEELLRSKDLRGSALTERQVLILRMMSEGRTNLAISGALGYSESTIRHETIRIYAKLGCNGRPEACAIYQEKYANPKAESAELQLALQPA